VRKQIGLPGPNAFRYSNKATEDFPIGWTELGDRWGS